MLVKCPEFNSTLDVSACVRRHTKVTSDPKKISSYIGILADYFICATCPIGEQRLQHYPEFAQKKRDHANTKIDSMFNRLKRGKG